MFFLLTKRSKSEINGTTVDTFTLSGPALAFKLLSLSLPGHAFTSVRAPPVAQLQLCDWQMGKDTSSMLIISLHASMLKAGIREKSEKIKLSHGQTHQIHIQVPVSVQIQALCFYLL